MNPGKLALALLPAVLAACAGQPVKPAQPPAAKPVEAPKPKAEGPKLPNVVLSEDLLFEFLVAEIAGQRGNIAVASETYVDMAKKTLDPRIAGRALDIALYSGNMKDALDMAELVSKLDPDSPKAKQALSALLIHSGNIDGAKPDIEKTLSRLDPESLSRSLLQLDALFSGQADKKAALQAVESLAKPYLDHPEAHYAIASSALRAGESQLALVEADKALALRPGWEMAALLHAQILESGSKESVEPYLTDFLKQYPKAQGVRLALAKFLVSERKYTEARREFETLGKLFPENQDVALAVALLSLQLGDTEGAISEFKALLDGGYRNPDLARYYLGQAEEAAKRGTEALKWYGSVGKGPQYLPARVNMARILMAKGDFSGAKRLLKETRTADAGQRLYLIQAEAQLLQEAGRRDAAYALLGRALEAHPDQPELLYDRAMAAERLGKIPEAEQNLKKLIRIQPGNAQAYNALGYTLVEHSTRYEEALPLLQKALELAPEDPYILDSMGWLQFRMGHSAPAIDYLKRAYAGRRDPEIAAHLVRALWAEGRHDEAKSLLDEALKDNPGNAALVRSRKDLMP